MLLRPVRLLLLAAIGLAACGGDTAGPPSPARSAFAEQADAICARLGRESVALSDRTFGTTGAPIEAAEVEVYERDLAALQRTGLRDLRALEPPPGEQARVGEFLDSFERVLERIAATPADQPGAPSADTARLDRLARDLGLRECAGA